MDKLLVGLALNGLAVCGLTEEGNDRGTGMTTDDGNLAVVGVRASDLTEEASSTDNIKGGDTENAAGVVDTGLLQRLRDNGDGGVDGVGDDEEVRLRRDTGDGGGEVADNRRVGLRSHVRMREEHDI